ncbi:hypothetical protein MEO39_25250 [Dolichospermum sp. ST_sed2]|nr:hypothetical protein [Dolichospermum sp. ST_sed2]MDD1474853.1 hypothetical protein [Dolichospermum sp. ST_sed4]
MPTKTRQRWAMPTLHYLKFFKYLSLLIPIFSIFLKINCPKIETYDIVVSSR